MIAHIVHVFSRLHDRVLVQLTPAYDAYCRALYRLLLRCTVHDPATRAALKPNIRHLGRRWTISSTFLRALNNPNTELITTPIERITRDGVQTADGVHRPRRPAGGGHRLRAVDRPRDLTVRKRFWAPTVSTWPSTTAPTGMVG